MRTERLWREGRYFVFGLVLGIGFLPSLRAQSGLYPCEPSPAVTASFEKLDVPVDVRQPFAERYAKTQSILDALFAENPEDYFVHRRYQKIAMEAWDADPNALIQRYKELLDKHPNKPEFLDLYGFTLNGYRTKEAAQYFDKALELAPNFPWPHVHLARVYAWRAFSRLGQAPVKPPGLRASLSRFARSLRLPGQDRRHDIFAGKHPALASTSQPALGH